MYRIVPVFTLAPFSLSGCMFRVGKYCFDWIWLNTFWSAEPFSLIYPTPYNVTFPKCQVYGFVIQKPFNVWNVETHHRTTQSAITLLHRRHPQRHPDCLQTYELLRWNRQLNTNPQWSFEPKLTMVDFSNAFLITRGCTSFQEYFTHNKTTSIGGF